MPVGTWNIAEVEFVESDHRLRGKFACVAGFWGIAFALIVCVSFMQLSAAEAEPGARMTTVSGPSAPTMLASVTGSSIALVLWQRIAAVRRT